MNRFHIIGGKNHGKTTLVVDLVREFCSRGVGVGTIKHTHHQHELDTLGKDSQRHREAGAAVAGILSRSMNAIFWPSANKRDKMAAADQDPDDRYAAFVPMFSHCDLVLVEGDTRTSAPKLEVWRALNETAPLAGSILNVQAIVTDDSIANALPILPRAKISMIADFILDFCSRNGRTC